MSQRDPDGSQMTDQTGGGEVKRNTKTVLIVDHPRGQLLRAVVEAMARDDSLAMPSREEVELPVPDVDP